MSTISLSSLKNKKMVVDIQMYLYGFLCNERTTLMNEVQHIYAKVIILADLIVFFCSSTLS